MNLNDRYYARFGLEYNPFIKNNSSYFFFESKDAEEVKYKLDYLFKVKGIGIITGNPGLGKTTNLRNYINNLQSCVLINDYFNRYRILQASHNTIWI